jgi:spermidine synthase
VGDLYVPVLTIDGNVWMSLTPMEIQSAHVPLSLSEGRVGTSGLGLGYFTLLAAESESVESVTVFEINDQIIEYFTESFKDRECFDKIEIVKGDVRETMKGYTFDTFFADHYQNLLDEEIPEDIRLLTKNNKIECYRFWGQELAYFAANNLGMFNRRKEIPGFTHIDSFFFSDFFVSKERAGLARTDVDDPEYVEEAIKALRLAEQRSRKLRAT